MARGLLSIASIKLHPAKTIDAVRAWEAAMWKPKYTKGWFICQILSWIRGLAKRKQQRRHTWDNLMNILLSRSCRNRALDGTLWKLVRISQLTCYGTKMYHMLVFRNTENGPELSSVHLERCTCHFSPYVLPTYYIKGHDII